MMLEDYLEFEQVGGMDHIRLKGTRITLEVVVREYLEGSTPEQIAANYRRSVTLEQVYAAITYYLANRPAMDAYLAYCQARELEGYEEFLKREPSALELRLRAVKGSHL